MCENASAFLFLLIHKDLTFRSPLAHVSTDLRLSIYGIPEETEEEVRVSKVYAIILIIIISSAQRLSTKTWKGDLNIGE
jgi:hypothetical protein